MKTTAIQDCIKEIAAKLDLASDYHDLSLYERGLVDAYVNIKKILESKLEKEEQDLKECFQDAYYMGIRYAQDFVDCDFNTYFTKTFIQNEI